MANKKSFKPSMKKDNRKKEKEEEEWMKRLLAKLYIVHLERWNDVQYIKAYGRDC